MLNFLLRPLTTLVKTAEKFSRHLLIRALQHFQRQNKLARFLESHEDNPTKVYHEGHPYLSADRKLKNSDTEGHRRQVLHHPFLILHRVRSLLLNIL